MPLFDKGKGEVVQRFYEMIVNTGEISVLYLGLSGLMIRTYNKSVAFDIADLLGRDGLSKIKNLDLLIYTHSHYDHYNLRHCLDVFERTNTRIIAESSIIRELKGRIPSENLIEANVGQKINVNKINIYVIEGKHVGPITLFLLELDDLKIFHGGDSGYTPLKGFTAEIAFVPTGHPSPTASPSDALKMIKDLQPKIVVPIHGAESEHDQLERLLEKEYPDIRVVRIEEFNPVKIKI